MSGDIKEIVSRLPPDKKIDLETCEFLDREIRKGAELNRLQWETVLTLVQSFLEQKLLPPAPYESFCAYVYNEWSEEAKRSEDRKRTLVDLVRALKANPAVASSVAQTVQQINKEREARRRQLERWAAAMRADEVQRDRQDMVSGDPPNAYLAKIQSARLGTGENAAPNLDIAALYADEALEIYPNSPKILFEAAGCHQLLAEKGNHLSALARYVHMKQAYDLNLKCLTCLTTQPYLNLKGEFDKWRKGLTELLVKIEKELKTLNEQQNK